jgi:hypothetical protein
VFPTARGISRNPQAAAATTEGDDEPDDDEDDDDDDDEQMVAMPVVSLKFPALPKAVAKVLKKQDC